MLLLVLPRYNNFIVHCLYLPKQLTLNALEFGSSWTLPSPSAPPPLPFLLDVHSSTLKICIVWWAGTKSRRLCTREDSPLKWETSSVDIEARFALLAYLGVKIWCKHLIVASEHNQGLGYHYSMNSFTDQQDHSVSALYKHVKYTLALMVHNSSSILLESTWDDYEKSSEINHMVRLFFMAKETFKIGRAGTVGFL